MEGPADVAAFGCGDEQQGLLYLLRRNGVGRGGLHDPLLPERTVRLGLPWPAGSCAVTLVNAEDGSVLARRTTSLDAQGSLDLTLGRDLLVVLKR
jgi:hypothetical protein